MVPIIGNTGKRAVEETLRLFPKHLLDLAESKRISVRLLKWGEHYAQASGELSRLQIDVDAWPAPPAGLFVVSERTVYLRSRSAMTVAHEFGHALDCALGDGVYLSSIEPAIRAAFSGARSFVTPYAATGVDEYFAEGMRAVAQANDPAADWPRATRESLYTKDPVLFEILSKIWEA